MAINTWDPTVPSAQSPAGQGDDEIRAIKQDVQAVFPALDVEIQNGAGNAAPTSQDFTDLFDKVNTLTANAGTLPLGLIVMWSGTIAEIPNGFTLCDGTNVNNREVPDLSAKFIVGTNALAPINATGGGEGATLDANPGTATVQLDPITLTEDQIPGHDHAMFVSQTATGVGTEFVGGGEAAAYVGEGMSDNNKPYGIAPSPNALTDNPNVGRTAASRTGTTTPISFNTATVTSGGHNHGQTLPNWYALAFIMYVGTAIAP